MCSRRVALASHRRRSPPAVAGTCRWGALSFGNSSITCSINRTCERVCSNTRANKPAPEGRKMTILDTREIQATPVVRPGIRPSDTRRRPGSRRPGGAPVRYRGTGVRMSRASHRRPITPATTVLLALVASAITVWLGLVAQFGGVVGSSATVPDQLAVIQVQTGENTAAGGASGGPGRPCRPGHRSNPRTQQARLRRTRCRPDADRAGWLTARCER